MSNYLLNNHILSLNYIFLGIIHVAENAQILNQKNGTIDLTRGSEIIGNGTMNNLGSVFVSGKTIIGVPFSNLNLLEIQSTQVTFHDLVHQKGSVNLLPNSFVEVNTSITMTGMLLNS